MVRCEGRKGAAIHRYNERMKATKNIVKSMPYKVDKNIIAAVYAHGKSYRIIGCEGMERAIDSVRITGKTEDGMYQVVWGNNASISVESKESLSKKLDSHFGVKCTQHDKSQEANEIEDNDRE